MPDFPNDESGSEAVPSPGPYWGGFPGAPAGPSAPDEPATSVDETVPTPDESPLSGAPPIPPPGAVWPSAPLVTGPAPDRSQPRRGLRTVLVAAVVGALVGALVSAGVYAAVDDSNGSSTAPVASQVIVRPSDKIATTGDIATILQADVPAVVAIVDDGGPDSGGAAGTGFVISSDGVIVTNNHVVEGASSIQAVFSDGTSRRATVLGKNAASDLAVVKVDGTNLPTITLGDSDQVQVGDDVVAIGNALALQGGLTVTRGIISGLHREVGTTSGESLEDVIQTDAAINPGNSGGPLVDNQGRVIGINTAIADPTSAQNVGFAIPISNAKTVIDQLRQGKQPAFLGVNSESIDQAKADGHDVSVDAGAYVVKVGAGTPAADAGIQTGDVITEFDGQTIDSAAALGGVVREHKPGDKVAIVVDRAGKKITVTATLGEAPTS